jgi:cytochrome P450
MTVIYNPFDPSFAANPYPTFTAMREEDPVHQIVMADGVRLLTRYADIDMVLRDRDRFSVDHRNLKRGPELEGVPYENIGSILFRDPPEHTVWRRTLAKSFTAAHVEALLPRLREVADEFLDRIEEKGEVDFIEEFAAPLPFQLIAELLGVPVADRPQVHAWASDIVNITEPVASPEVSQAIARSSDEMRAYLKDLCADKRAQPGDDVISRMVANDDGGFAEDELVEHVLLLQVSAPEPTTSLLAHGALALARDPEQAQVLRDDPSLDGNAVEEMLRYEAPLQLTGRYPLEDLELHGQRIEAGTALVLSLASANHDPARWGPTADDVDVRRDHAQDHLSFARGVHTCFGAALARLEGRETFGRLVRRFPDLKLSAEPEWNSLLCRRGPTKVLISVR